MTTAHHEAKAFVTLRAQYALRGHVVHELRDGGYIVCRHGHAYYAKDFAALLAFAQRVGVLQSREVDRG